MKLYIKYYSIILVLFLIGCNDEFMDRFPETSISPGVYFETIKDLELYTNTYYDLVSPQFCDYVSDNCAAYSDASPYNDLIRGNITPATVGGWNDWGTLRRFNFFMDNVHRASGSQDQINHYTGITRLHRAIWYYEKVKKYSDVPWYSQALNDTDEDLLYKARDPRTLVVDSIVADLDFAAEHISESMGNRTQFNKWYALAMLARICLHEGTFRKYHDELNLQSTANIYLGKAADASQRIMDSGLFRIDKSGGADKAYFNLFTRTTLSQSPEILFFKDYSVAEHITHLAGGFTFSSSTNLSRSLMESYEYLTNEGKAVPFTSIEGYEKTGFIDAFKNRDPRFKQTFMYPGYLRPQYTTPFRPNMNFGGYPQIKFMAPETIGTYAESDLPVSRYAEVLLIYAEAKCELGTLTQADIDKSINEIRSRVEMPPVIIGQLMDDPNLNNQYPKISDRVLLEIRRERRIELMSENFRWDDLMRWKEGHLIEQVQQGAYIDKFGLFDVTGDGVPDIGIYKNEATNPIPEDERGDYSFYYLENNNGVPGTFSLSEGESGYVTINGEIGRRSFKEPQYYYLPLPQTQRTLNPNLKETIFWDE